MSCHLVLKKYVLLKPFPAVRALWRNCICMLMDDVSASLCHILSKPDTLHAATMCMREIFETRPPLTNVPTFTPPLSMGREGL